MIAGENMFCSGFLSLFYKDRFLMNEFSTLKKVALSSSSRFSSYVYFRDIRAITDLLKKQSKRKI
jgi:hypothetical protein